PSSFLFSLYPSAPPLYLHSFPTRRSSDLAELQVDTLRSRFGGDHNFAPFAKIIDQRGAHVSSLGPRDTIRSDVTRQPFLIDGFRDRKSTRLNSSHVAISYAVFCLKKKITK